MNALDPQGLEGSSGQPAEAGLRDSISAAGQRIDEVVEAAERVAVELREDARREAEQYLEERRQEADSLVAERATALSKLSDSLVRQVDDLGQQSRALADRIDRVAEEIRGVLEEEVEHRADPASGAQALLAEAPTGGEPADEEEPDDLDLAVGDEHPAADPLVEDVIEEALVEEALEAEALEAEALEAEADLEEEDLEEEVVEGREAAGSDEALLRATQMAIAGEPRSVIEAQLRSEFHLDDPDPLLDQVLGPERG